MSPKNERQKDEAARTLTSREAASPEASLMSMRDAASKLGVVVGPVSTNQIRGIADALRDLGAFPGEVRPPPEFGPTGIVVPMVPPVLPQLRAFKLSDAMVDLRGAPHTSARTAGLFTTKSIGQIGIIPGHLVTDQEACPCTMEVPRSISAELSNIHSAELGRSATPRTIRKDKDEVGTVSNPATAGGGVADSFTISEISTDRGKYGPHEGRAELRFGIIIKVSVTIGKERPKTVEVPVTLVARTKNLEELDLDKCETTVFILDEEGPFSVTSAQMAGRINDALEAYVQAVGTKDNPATVTITADGLNPFSPTGPAGKPELQFRYFDIFVFAQGVSGECRDKRMKVYRNVRADKDADVHKGEVKELSDDEKAFFPDLKLK